MKNQNPIAQLFVGLGLMMGMAAQAQLVNSNNLVLQQAISKLRVIPALPINASGLNDTTSNFAIMATNRRSYAAGHATGSVSNSPYNYLMIADYKDTLIGSTMKHFAYQTMRSYAKDLIKGYFGKITSKTASGNVFDCTTRTSNFNYEVIEQRNYTGAKVTSFEIPKLSASVNAALDFKVELDAANVTTTYPGGRDNALVPSGRSLTTSNWRASMSTISSTSNSRITEISAIKLTPVSNASTGQIYQVSDFTIDVVSSFAQEWTQWLQSPNRATDLRTFRIALMDAALRNEMLVVELSKVEIISMNNLPASGGAIAKTRIGLRATSVTMKLNY